MCKDYLRLVQQSVGREDDCSRPSGKNGGMRCSADRTELAQRIQRVASRVAFEFPEEARELTVIARSLERGD